MKYLVEVAPQELSLEEVAPHPLVEGEVRVRVAYVGVCHSDTAHIAEGRGPFPARMGHEVSGIVTESTVEHVPTGAHVAAYVTDGYATEVILPADHTVALHPGCSLLDGALAEPLACVLGGIGMLDLSGDSGIVLVGAGFMGLLALRVLVAQGHGVTVIEPRESARRRAVEWGADRVLTPDEALPNLAQSSSVVIEATGSAAGLQLASDIVRIAGTLGIMGYHQSGGGKRTVDMETWNFRALRVLNLHHRNTDDVLRWMERAQRLSANGIVRPSELVNTLVDLDGLPAALLSHPGLDSIKTALVVSDAAAASE